MKTKIAIFALLAATTGLHAQTSPLHSPGNQVNITADAALEGTETATVRRAYIDNGTVTLSGSSSWTLTDALYVGTTSGPNRGTLTIQDNALLVDARDNTINRTTMRAFGTLNLLGGTLVTNGFYFQSPPGTLNLNGGTIRAASAAYSSNFFQFFSGSSDLAIGKNGFTFDTNGFNITAQNKFTGDGGITKTGAGTLTMSGANTFKGDIAVRQGTLNFSNGFTLSDNDIIFTLNNNGICGKIAGKLTFTGETTVYLDFATDFDFSLNDYTYQLFTGNLIGDLNFASSDPHWTVNVLSFGGGTLKFELNAVPEPSTCLLLLGGAGALALRRRRVA